MNALAGVDDWAAAQEQWSRWWQRKGTCGPLLGLTAPLDRHPNLPGSAGPEPDDRAWWLDMDGVLARTESEIARTAYMAEAFPYLTASLGPGSLCTFLGCTPFFDRNTVWYEPCINDIGAAQLRFEPDNPWWQWTIEMTARAKQRGAGRYVVAMPDLIENLDVLASLMGTEELLYALASQPQEVHRLQRQLLPLWFEAFDALYHMVKDARGGMAWMAFVIWAPGRLAKLQCDFSAMISSAMFRDFVVPYLVQQCDRLDYSLYHLDGPQALHHLDDLLAIESLDCVQWTPGAAFPEGGDPCWDWLYRKILDAGKLVQAVMPAAQVRPFVQRLGDQGIYILCKAQTETDARQLVRDLRWT
jgi:hypothetical protein